MFGKNQKTIIGRNIWALRDVLFDEIENLQNGKSNPQKAQAVARLAAQIIESAKVEVIHGAALQKAIENKLEITERASVQSLPKGND